MEISFGEGYKSYGIVPPKTVKISDDDATVLGLRENEDGKLWNVVLWASNKTTGMATSLQFAKMFDDSFDENDTSKLKTFITDNYYASGNMAIVTSESKDGAYLFMIMNYDMAKDIVDNLDL
jgi:hypothetical protein